MISGSNHVNDPVPLWRTPSACSADTCVVARLTAPKLYIAVLLLLSAGIAIGQPYDLLITGGRVLDGTGNPATYADVAIQGGKVAAIGRLRGAAAARTIDAKSKYVCPGFIDMHSHADGGLASEDRRRRSAPNLVSQGITTVCVNPDGASPWPLSKQRAAY
jgi:N-acyl-D-amino-acid deacylase